MIIMINRIGHRRKVGTAVPLPSQTTNGTRRDSRPYPVAKNKKGMTRENEPCPFVNQLSLNSRGHGLVGGLQRLGPASEEAGLAGGGEESGVLMTDCLEGIRS